MDQRRRPQTNRHITAVPDLTCEKCMELARELEAKTEIVMKLSRDNTEMAEQVSGAMEAARATGKENGHLVSQVRALKGQLTRDGKAPADDDIERLLAFWKESHPKALTPPDGKRWEVCKKALKLMKGDDAGPVRACLEALEGIRLFPFMQYGNRFNEPAAGRVLRNDVEHALGDEVRIAKARMYARWAKADKAERCWQMYQWTQTAAEYWSALALEGLSERRRVPVAEAVARMPKDDGHE